MPAAKSISSARSLHLTHSRTPPDVGLDHIHTRSKPGLNNFPHLTTNSQPFALFDGTGRAAAAASFPATNHACSVRSRPWRPSATSARTRPAGKSRCCPMSQSSALLRQPLPRLAVLATQRPGTPAQLIWGRCMHAARLWKHAIGSDDIGALVRRRKS